MKKVTLCFCLKNDHVLLAMKKRGFGAGKWNGYGGKVDGGEQPSTAAVRELKEESGIAAEVDALRQVGHISFYFEEVPFFECYVYTIQVWQNDPVETSEMKPKWFPVEDLPFAEMWAADIQLVPMVLKSKSIQAEVHYNADGSVLEDFSYRSVKFV